MKSSPAASPVVTVLIAAYNAAPFIAETINSVFAQTRPDLELIVIDDGSTDGTPDVVARLDDPRLRLMRQENGGPASALNAALPSACGRFIALLDHDDLWAPTKLARHIEVFEHQEDVDLTFSWARFINASGKPLSLHSRHDGGRVGFRDLLADYIIGPTSSVLMRRSVLDVVGTFDESYLRYYDVDLFLRVALARAGNVQAIPEELTLYRRRAGQMSADWEGMQQDWERLLCKFRHLAPEETAAAQAVGNANMHRYFAYLAYENRDYRTALRLLRSAAATNGRLLPEPRNVKLALACLAGSLTPKWLYARVEEFAGLR